MFVHFGVDSVVKEDDIIGIFDLDSTTVSKHTRKFLNEAEKQKQVINVSFELPKSFILCGEKGKTKVFISQLSSSTLYKRSKIL